MEIPRWKEDDLGVDTCSHCGATVGTRLYQCPACHYRLANTSFLDWPEVLPVPIVCKRCQAENPPTVSTCQNCGAALETLPRAIDQETLPTRPQGAAPIRPFGQPIAMFNPSFTRPGSALSVTRVNSEVLVLTLGQGVTVRLTGRSEYFVGRSDPVVSWMPHVDLTQFGGGPAGVSRRHARIFYEQNGLHIEDIGSLNGTYINTVRLITRVPHPLHSGDELRFGSIEATMHLE